jgi:hypothetical protein
MLTVVRIPWIWRQHSHTNTGNHLKDYGYHNPEITVRERSQVWSQSLKLMFKKVITHLWSWQQPFGEDESTANFLNTVYIKHTSDNGHVWVFIHIKKQPLSQTFTGSLKNEIILIYLYCFSELRIIWNHLNVFKIQRKCTYDNITEHSTSSNKIILYVHRQTYLNVITSAWNGLVYDAGILYQNFFLFLNFIPALNNIYYIH